MEEMHVFIDSDTYFGGSILDGFLYDLESEVVSMMIYYLDHSDPILDYLHLCYF